MLGADATQRILSGFLLALCASPVLAQSHAPPAPVEDRVEDIVVTARRGPPPVLLEPVAYLQRYCFDPARRTRQFSAPDSSDPWTPLDDVARAQFHITDDAVPAFGLSDPARGRTMALKMERFSLPRRLVERRCTLVVVGNADQNEFIGQINKLFNGPGTQRHVGDPVGVPRIPGWSQWLWTGNPQRGSKHWEVIAPTGAARSAGTWLVVTDDSFYGVMDYIACDLKVRSGGQPTVSVFTFSFVTRV